MQFVALRGERKKKQLSLLAWRSRRPHIAEDKVELKSQRIFSPDAKKKKTLLGKKSITVGSRLDLWTAATPRYLEHPQVTHLCIRRTEKALASGILSQRCAIRKDRYDRGVLAKR